MVIPLFPLHMTDKKSKVIQPKSEKLTKEQKNRIVRAHKMIQTLTLDEINERVKELQADLSSCTDLDLLFNSIKTLKAADALKQLLAHPRPDVNRLARECTKISFFKKHQDMLNLTEKNPL